MSVAIFVKLEPCTGKKVCFSLVYSFKVHSKIKGKCLLEFMCPFSQANLPFFPYSSTLIFPAVRTISHTVCTILSFIAHCLNSFDGFGKKSLKFTASALPISIIPSSWNLVDKPKMLNIRSTKCPAKSLLSLKLISPYGFLSKIKSNGESGIFIMAVKEPPSLP